MIHDSHGAAKAAGEQPLLPATASITNGVKLAIVAGVLCSIMQGMFVGMSSGFGRVWPSVASTKVPLPPANLSP